MGLKVLVLSAHPDDAEVGCGGTIVKHIERGDRVKWHTFAGKGYFEKGYLPVGWPADTLSTEFEAAMKALEVSDFELHDFEIDTLDDKTELRDLVYKLWKKFKPHVVYVPWARSRHQDHRGLGECAIEVSWSSGSDTMAYSVLNDFSGFTPTVFSLLSREQLEKKMLAMDCYKSQFEQREWFTGELTLAHSRSYGIFAGSGTGHAEVFEQVRRVI